MAFNFANAEEAGKAYENIREKSSKEPKVIRNERKKTRNKSISTSESPPGPQNNVPKKVPKKVDNWGRDNITDRV